MKARLKLVLTSELHFLEHEGSFYTETLGDYRFWRRYLDVFGSVSVAARTTRVTSLPASARPVDGEGVDVTALPDFVGPIAGVSSMPQLLALIRPVAWQDAAFILRVPGIVSAALYWWLRQRRWPYAVRVVGDPAESLSPQALRKPWTHGVRPVFVQAMRRQCRDAACAAYVTRWTLQSRYPTKAGFVTSFSDVDIPESLFAAPPSIEARLAGGGAATGDGSWRLIFVGSLAQRYKGLHVLLQALHLCDNAGLRLGLRVLGDGVHRAEYEQMASDLGLGRQVQFVGQVGSDLVWQHLRESDLFVMPSLTEGLPRAMLEAMACGVPCLGSSVGGIPELLDPQDMVPPGDARALAGKLREVLGNRPRLLDMAQRNRQVAQEYRADVLYSRSTEFWRQLSAVTLAHMQRIGSPLPAEAAFE